MKQGDVWDAYRKHAGLVRSVAIRMLGDDDAEDIVQEVFAVALRSKFDGRSTVGTWLYRITYNMCIDALRKSSREIPEPAHQEVPTPESYCRMDSMFRAIEQLSERKRYVIMSTAAGAPMDEIAQVLGVEPHTCRTILHRARLEIRERLKRWEDDSA